MSKFLASIRIWGPVVSATVAAAVMAGCAPFGQQPARQAITPLAQFDPGLALRSARGRADVDAHWWRAFGDPQLDRVLADALADAPSLKAQRARVDEALAQADVSAAASLPRLGASASALPQRLPRSYNVPPPAAGHWQVNAQALLNASFDLDVAGRLRALTRAATLRADQQQALERAATVSLQAALVETYLQLALELQLLEIAQDTLRQQDYLLRLTRQRAAAGLDMPAAVARAGEPLPLAAAEVERQHAAVALLRHRLAALVGRGPGYADTLTPAPGVLRALAPLPATLPAALVGRRPDILAARYRVEAESAGIDAARASFYPDINLLAFAGVQSFGFRALLHGSSGAFGAGPAITLPIFEGGRLRAGLRAQTDAYNAAVADYDDTVVHALAQVSDSLVQLDSLARQRDLTLEALARAQSTYEIETRRYQKGISGYLDVLLAETRLLEDRRSVARADTSLAVEHVRLIAALGGATNPGAQP
ncbi:Outer membrane protein OprM [Burkholderia glumae]|uniref:efflux transporter outer membrane subunit n=2 Tax=Burkholderia glumae TaxID=337 RepID=UPI00137462C2|nr:efflux transporter outer membrane subunit [Burkholderia glumae]QHP93229.1 efflux transporter outer membrane subunit [Burkholderia glumae]QKM50827.1 Outer membrane protein OprM [Burkholderia glumae]